MCTVTPIRGIPVCNADGVIVDRVDSARARRLALAPNATVVRKRRGSGAGAVVRILLGSTSDDSLADSLHGNPRSYSHNHETDTNPEKVWTLKRIPSDTADIFGAVVLDCAA
jgi:hypothetical protein